MTCWPCAMSCFKERKDILQAWQRKYQYILIDEFQDINQIQYEIVQMLALPENNLFIVGDDDQSIYRFRGARPELMLGFEKDYPDAERILLDVNYRCVDPVIESAGKLIANNKTRFQKEIHGNQGKRLSCICKRVAGPFSRRQRLLQKNCGITTRWGSLTKIWRFYTAPIRDQDF